MAAASEQPLSEVSRDGAHAHLLAYAESVRAPLYQEIAALRATNTLLEEKLRVEQSRGERLRRILQLHTRAANTELTVNQPLAKAPSAVSAFLQTWVGVALAHCSLHARPPARDFVIEQDQHDYPDHSEDEVRLHVAARSGTADVGSSAAAAVSAAMSQAWRRVARKNQEALCHQDRRQDRGSWPASLATVRQDYNVVVRVDTTVGVHALSDPLLRQHVRRITQSSAPSVAGSVPQHDPAPSHPASISGANGGSFEALSPSASPSLQASWARLESAGQRDAPVDGVGVDEPCESDKALAMCLTQVRLDWTAGGPKAVMVICKPTSSVMATFARALLQLFKLGLTVVVEPKMFDIIVAQLQRCAAGDADASGASPSFAESALRPLETHPLDADGALAGRSGSCADQQELEEFLALEDDDASPDDAPLARDVQPEATAPDRPRDVPKPRRPGSFAATISRTISRVVSKTAFGGGGGGGDDSARAIKQLPKLRHVTPVTGLLSQQHILRRLSKASSHPSTTDLVSLRGPIDIKATANLEAQELADALHGALSELLPEFALLTGADAAAGRAGVAVGDWMAAVRLEGGLTTALGGNLVTWVAKQAPHSAPVVPQQVALVLDAIVTLGGDGTMLWACKIMGSHPVPPVVPFAMGSLGFMTPFCSEYLNPVLQALTAGGVQLLLRHRLECWVLRSCEVSGESRVRERHLILNDVSVHRGNSPFLTNVEVYCDDTFVTNVQGDGLLLATPTGSTAYSLAAGGSMVHPSVPGILFTPICPHSLSFRPLVFPDHVQLRVQVPENVRNSEMRCSFDGSDHIVLRPGDALVVQLSKQPVVTVCDVNVSHDWFCSVREGLYWNLRKMQGLQDKVHPHDSPAG